VSSGCGKLNSLISFRDPIDHVGQAAFECPTGLGGCLSFGDLAEVVLLAAATVTDLADSDDVKRTVQSPVASGVEAMADFLATGGIQGALPT
jgi:hypothetical protein